MEKGFVLSQNGPQIQDILNYVEQQLPGTLEALSKAIGDEATRATNKENELLGAIGGLIPKSEKGAANGVASLNGGGQVPNDQLQWSLRGVLNPSDIDKLTLTAGIYQVNGKVLGPGILDGEQANGVLLQFAWDSRLQVLYVGRAAGASAGEQVEIYTRRYIPTPKRWTAWSKAGGGSGGGEVYMVNIEIQGSNYTMDKTYEEVRAAAEGGAVVIATNVMNQEQLFLGDFASGGLTFFGVVSLSSMLVYIFPYQAGGTRYQIDLNSSNLLIVDGSGVEASHSSTEIAAAVTAGKMPVLKVGNKFFLLYSISGGVAIFRRMDDLNIVEEYTIYTEKNIEGHSIDGSLSQIGDVIINSPQEGQVLVYLPEHEEEGLIVPAGWYNRTLSYPSMSQYEALVARVAALEQNQ